MKRIGFAALSVTAIAATAFAVTQGTPSILTSSTKTTAINSTPIAFAPVAIVEAPVAIAAVPAVETPATAPAPAAAVVEAPEAPVAKAMAIQIAPTDDKTPAVETVEQKTEIVEAPTPPAPPVITLVAKVDLATQKLTVLEHGKAKYTWTISSGTREFQTPRGTFQPDWMAKMWFSRKYDNSPMPHSVFFKDGAAIHATQWTGQLGRPASHGCVRLAPANAAKFYALVSSHGMKHTRISVFGSPRFAPEAVASRRAPQQSAQRVANYTGGYSNSYNSYAGNYVAPGSYASNGTAFMPKPVAYRPQPVQVRVVQYNNRGVRY